MGEVPADGTMIMAHKKEMVLPASIASPLRAMLASGGAANINAPGAANDGGGETHIHYHDHSGTLNPSQIIANRSAVAKAVRMAHKEGAFAGAGFSPG